MKKALALVLCIVICASALISGTVAFFTDEESQINVFEVGYVDIIQHEQKRDNNDNLVDYDNENPPKLSPLVDRQNGEPTSVEKDFDEKVSLVNPKRFGGYADKIVTVENEGENVAYLRNIVAIPTGGVDVPWLGYNFCDANTSSNTDWDSPYKVSDVEIDGVEYDLFVFNYIGSDNPDPNSNEIIPAGHFQPGDTTMPTLLGFFLSSSVDFEETITGSEGNYKDPSGNSVPAVIKNSAGTVLGAYFYRDENGNRTYIDITSLNNNHILVASQAVQADGFASFDQAFANAFKGDITADNHPWYKAPVAPSEPTVAEDAAGKKYTWAQLNPEVEDGKLTSIDVNFINNNGITKLTLPDEVTSISDFVFQNCSSLQNINMPEVTSVGDCAFRGYASLETVSMPKVTSIGNYAFQGCASLVTVSMPKVTSIGNYAFYGCASLETVTIPAGADYPTNAFPSTVTVETI